MKTTAVAPANVGLIKYWGRKDERLRIPLNGSISVNLSNLLTTTTVEFNDELQEDEVTINGKQDTDKASRVVRHLDLIRKSANVSERAKVVSYNSFPTGTGLSSSSSGFAALTLAATNACGFSLCEKELSIIARQGSGSACRSIPDGFVEWRSGITSENSYAVSIYPPDHWEIADIVAVVSEAAKDISSTEGQKFVGTSPFFTSRISKIDNKINRLKEILFEKNFPEFGKLIEEEALELHAVMLTSSPSLIYWTPKTLKVMKLVRIWRSEGLPVYFTINTGQDIHLFCEKENVKKVFSLLKELEEVKEIIVNYPSVGAKIIDNHLF